MSVSTAQTPKVSIATAYKVAQFDAISLGRSQALQPVCTISSGADQSVTPDPSPSR